MFQKGRARTGGRPAGVVSKAKRSSRFLERLKGYGFNYDQELSTVLKQIRDLAKESKPDPVRIAELKFYYTELKSLLPYMTPKLREKEVTTVDEPEQPASTESISDEDLLKALGNGKQTETKPRPSNPPLLAKGNAELQVSAGADEDTSDMAGVEEED